ncbi:MAG: aldolase/citrate lyase family protein [Pseudomonadota bacterium]
MAQATLKARLRSGQPAVGCWLNLYSTMAAEIISQAGYDCAMIDMEHGQGDTIDAIALMQAIQGRDCTPYARVPSNDPVAIKRILDAGAQGVMVPAVNSAEEAAAAVAACRYPPEGIRGVAPVIVRAADYGADWQSYTAAANETILVICQIESGAAVAAVEEIAAVEGVDLLFVGPFDLSANLGFLGQPDHPEVRAEIARVEQAAKSAGKLLGAIPTPDRSLEALHQTGYDLILADADVALLRDGARASAKRALAALGRDG